MMDASDPSEVMRQIPSNDREYLGDFLTMLVEICLIKNIVL